MAEKGSCHIATQSQSVLSRSVTSTDLVGMDMRLILTQHERLCCCRDCCAGSGFCRGKARTAALLLTLPKRNKRSAVQRATQCNAVQGAADTHTRAGTFA